MKLFVLPLPPSPIETIRSFCLDFCIASYMLLIPRCTCVYVCVCTETIFERTEIRKDRRNYMHTVGGRQFSIQWPAMWVCGMKSKRINGENIIFQHFSLHAIHQSHKYMLNGLVLLCLLLCVTALWRKYMTICSLDNQIDFHQTEMMALPWRARTTRCCARSTRHVFFPFSAAIATATAAAARDTSDTSAHHTRPYSAHTCMSHTKRMHMPFNCLLSASPRSAHMCQRNDIISLSEENFCASTQTT